MASATAWSVAVTRGGRSLDAGPSAKDGALPALIGIGAMKAGTSALHRYLSLHPDLAMAEPKELNFFYGAQQPARPGTFTPTGNWWRGTSWYRRHFPDGGRRGGEISPGYTSPDHPGVASRMASVVPDVRLVYLVRDPLDRAVSQYRHHVRDGTEQRPIEEALLDPQSQYLSRSRYHARLRPFLAHFRSEQLLVVTKDDLDHDRRATLARVFTHAGVAPHWDPAMHRRWHTAPGPAPSCPRDVEARFRAAVADDVADLRLRVRSDVPWLRRV